MIIRIRLVMACALALLAVPAAWAQSPFPPAGSEVASQPAAGSPFPPVGGGAAPASPFPPAGGGSPGMGMPPGGAFGAPQQRPQEPPCLKDFMPLRQDAERRAGLIQAASKRKAPPAEACKLIRGFAESQNKMLKFMQARAASCGIPAQVTEQIKAGYNNALQLQNRVCAAANGPQGSAGPSLSEALGSPSLPDAGTPRRSGGSTFDTLNGNVLQR